LISDMTTLHPSSAKRVAIAAPKPDPPPSCILSIAFVSS
jgi:hypothetical protein